MPRYVIGGVEVPVDPNTSVNIALDKEALKKAKEAEAAKPAPVPSAPAASASSKLLIAGVAAVGIWVAFGDKIKAKFKKQG